MSKRAVLACLFAVLGMTTASVARADTPRITTDWQRAFVEGQLWASGRSILERRPTQASAPDVAPGAGSLFLPRLTIVARDWGESHRLFGSDVSVTDLQRVSRSTRVVVSRLSMGGGTFSPFVQVAFGQYRVDPSLLLSLPQHPETAAQLGGGFQLSLSPRWRFGCEANVTQFYREGRSDDDLPIRRVVGGLLASRLTFD